MGGSLTIFNKFVILGLNLMQNFVPDTFALMGSHPQIALSGSKWGIMQEIRTKTEKTAKIKFDMSVDF